MIHHMKQPENLHTVYMYGGILAVRCKACRQGAVFTAESMPAIKRGNMTTVDSPPFICSHCKSRDFETFIARTTEQGHAFVAGGDPGSWRK